jgi:ribokinase
VPQSPPPPPPPPSSSSQPPSSSQRPTKVAVVGHVEWVQFARVDAVPRAGEVVHARDPFEEPAGGGAVAAVQLARLAGACTLYTALGDDGPGRASVARLTALGVEVRAGFRQEPTRRAVTLVDSAGERTITTFGRRLDPQGEDPELDWEGLRGVDALYFTSGDRPALELARERSRVLVASPRARHALGGGVPIDALVLSGEDEIELRMAEPAREEAALLVLTEGARGGRYVERGGAEGRWRPAPPSPRAEQEGDAYGCGDSFAAGLTYGLGAALGLDAALALAARCGAECLGGRGPYERQLQLKG